MFDECIPDGTYIYDKLNDNYPISATIRVKDGKTTLL